MSHFSTVMMYSLCTKYFHEFLVYYTPKYASKDTAWQKRNLLSASGNLDAATESVLSWSISFFSLSFSWWCNHHLTLYIGKCYHQNEVNTEDLFSTWFRLANIFTYNGYLFSKWIRNMYNAEMQCSWTWFRR